MRKLIIGQCAHRERGGTLNTVKHVCTQTQVCAHARTHTRSHTHTTEETNTTTVLVRYITTDKEAADQTFHLTHSQHTDTGPDQSQL